MIVSFVHPDGREEKFEGALGDSVMRVATNNLVAGIIGECGGETSCATCHVFVDDPWLSRLPDRSPDEADMLEVAAAEPTDRSRLGCQIKMCPETDGIVVRIPDVQ